MSIIVAHVVLALVVIAVIGLIASTKEGRDGLMAAAAFVVFYGTIAAFFVSAGTVIAYWTGGGH